MKKVKWLYLVVFQFGCPNLNLNLELTLMYSRKTNKTKKRTKLPELFDAIIEGQNFSWTYKSKCQGIKEEYEIFSTIISHFELFHLTIDNCSSLKIRGCFGDQGLCPLETVPRGFGI